MSVGVRMRVCGDVSEPGEWTELNMISSMTTAIPESRSAHSRLAMTT